MFGGRGGSGKARKGRKTRTAPGGADVPGPADEEYLQGQAGGDVRKGDAGELVRGGVSDGGGGVSVR